MAAHIRTRPEDNANRLGIAPLIADVLLDECVAQLFSVLPCCGRRHAARIEPVEIPPRRQYIDAICRRCPRRARFDISARECPQRLRDLSLCPAQTRYHVRHNLVQCMGKCGTLLGRGCGNNREPHRPLDRLRRIVMCTKEGDQRTHLRLDRIQLSAVGHAVRCHTLAVREQILIVIARLLCNKTDKRLLPAVLHANERAQKVDELFPLRHAPEDMQPRADLHILDVRHIVVKRCSIVVEVRPLFDLILEVTGSSLLSDKHLRSLYIVRL